MQPQTFQRLGTRTFWIFLLDRARIAFLVLVLTIASNVWLGAGKITQILWLVWLLVSVVTVFVAWLIYSRYGYILDTDAFKMKRGVFGKEVVAIPYRQIQDVDIERTLFYRMMGVSKLAILTAGHSDDSEDGKSDSEAEIPLLDKNLAASLQQELLTKANVQKVVEVKPESQG
jgi:uncharacterized membrane protein YdbT with pleckstrin-like domain